jgi:hypothetical protein
VIACEDRPRRANACGRNVLQHKAAKRRRPHPGVSTKLIYLVARRLDQQPRPIRCRLFRRLNHPWMRAEHTE